MILMSDDMTDMTEKDIRDRCEEVGECWIWQQGTTSNGYPQVKLRGRGVQLVRRIAAEIAGKKLSPKQPVETTCWEKLCVNPAHMRPTTRSAIGKQAAQRGAFSSPTRAAKIAAARRASGVKLSDEQVDEIRESSDPGPLLAKKYGVHRSYIVKIRRGEVMRDYGNPFFGLMAR